MTAGSQRATPADQPPPAPALRLGPWWVRAASWPVRAARRRPLRAMGVVLGVAVVLTALSALGGWFWFHHHLRAATSDAEKWHNAEAARHLGYCQAVDPTDRDVILLSARLTRRAGAFAEAQTLLDAYWQRYGDDDALAFEFLLQRAARGELEGVSNALFARIAEGGEPARLAREALVVGFTQRFLAVEAHQVLTTWMADHPEDPVALLLFGKFLEQRQGFDDALVVYRRVLELDPAVHEARLRIATLLVQKRAGAEATSELEVLRRALPDNAEVQVLWAKSLELSGKLGEARAALDACLAIHPGYAPALAERGGIALTDEDDPVAAEAYLARAVNADPSDLTTRNRYALALGRNGKAAEAAKEYDRIAQIESDSERISKLIEGPLQKTPNDPNVHYEIGSIALRAGLTDQAIRWFQNTIRIAPDHTAAHRALASVYHELGNPALSARHRALASQGKHGAKP